MSASDSDSDLAGNFPSQARFAPTQWSVVLSAGHRADSQAAQFALEELCRIYWPPLYAFVRRQGKSPHDAQDLTQAFFADLLGREDLKTVDPRRGRFRSFLLASLKHFLANQHDKARAKKRGGGQVLVPLDAEKSESGYHGAAIDRLSPDRIFERRWALLTLERAMTELRNEYVDKLPLFEAIKGALTEPRGSTPYAAIAAKLGLSEAAVKMAVHRLRGRYQELIRAQVRETVTDPGEVEEELRQVMQALSA